MLHTFVLLVHTFFDGLNNRGEGEAQFVLYFDVEWSVLKGICEICLDCHVVAGPLTVDAQIGAIEACFFAATFFCAGLDASA